MRSHSAASDFDSGKLHLWSIALDEHASEPLRELLTTDELARAGKFHFQRDAARFAVGRALLRTLLASYLGERDPRRVQLRDGVHGKPMLVDGNDIHFNLAHCGGFALLGIARGVEIGVDVEHVHDFTDMPMVMRASFAPSEVQAIAALGEAERVEAFYRCWTRKEAVLKALGWGLARPLDSFVVDVGEHSPALLWMDGETPEAVVAWRLHHLVPTDGYIAAMAWRGADLTLESFRYEA
jgi:4'-phosphopantetheinyl transferase